MTILSLVTAAVNEHFSSPLNSPTTERKAYHYRSCTCVYRNRGQIEFRPVDDLEQVVHSLDVGPHRPYALCAVTSSPSQLLFCDFRSGKVYQVDCNTKPPRLMGEIPTVHDRQRVVTMCTLGGLLVLTRCKEGVFVYTLDGTKLKWKVSGKPPGMDRDIHATGVTADNQGHLFVCDKENQCVHALSVRDGSHLGVVVRKTEQGVGMPWNVTWHQDSSSLIVAHSKDAVWHLSIFSHQQ